MLLRVPGLGVKAVDAILASPALAHAAARRCRAADGLDRQGAAVHRRRRLAPDAADRPRRPARAARAEGRAAGAVRGMSAPSSATADCRRAFRCVTPARARRFRGLARAARARWSSAGVPPDEVALAEPGGGAATCSPAATQRLPRAAGATRVRPCRKRLRRAGRRARSATATPSASPALRAAAGGCSDNRRLMEDRADPLRPPARANWPRRCAATSTRCAPSSASARSRRRAATRFVAWFEPEHHIVRANAGFFVRRFANMRWSILTPEVSLHWDGETLTEGPRRDRAPTRPHGDPVEETVARPTTRRSSTRRV